MVMLNYSGRNFKFTDILVELCFKPLQSNIKVTLQKNIYIYFTISYKSIMYPRALLKLSINTVE